MIVNCKIIEYNFIKTLERMVSYKNSKWDDGKIPIRSPGLHECHPQGSSRHNVRER